MNQTRLLGKLIGVAYVDEVPASHISEHRPIPIGVQCCEIVRASLRFLMFALQAKAIRQTFLSPTLDVMCEVMEIVKLLRHPIIPIQLLVTAQI